MKCIPFDKVVEIYNRIDGFVPKNKDARACRAYALVILNEVMGKQTEFDEYDSYLTVQHNFYLEDAHNFVAEWIANDRGVDVDDLTDEDLDGYDYEYLVDRYEDEMDCNVAFNDTWQYIVDNYMRG